MANPRIPDAQQLQEGQFLFQEGPTIGRGGLATVHSIRVTVSRSPENPVGCLRALKRLNDKWRAHPAMVERFEREISALGQMSHSNIITLHGVSLPGQQRFYVMPLFGNTLRRFIAVGGQRGDWRAIASHGASLAGALNYAHQRGFIHRDFKPDNVLFNAGGPLVIADWGLGYFVHRESQVLQSLTIGGMGTAYYCSSEQWNTGKCDPRGDIYSLGMTLDEWVTGRQRMIRIGAGIGGPTTLDPYAGAQRFNSLLQKMTHSQAAGRPATMREVEDELRTLARA
jgi:serine/threonine-protein kinase PpkA